MTNQSTFESIVSWVRKGYPEGIDPTEFPPLLALLTRVLDEQEVTTVALTLAREYGTDTPLTEEQIHDAITRVTAQEPNAEEINQVASRLAAAGWPLTTEVTVG
ncbi:hypothetical protein GOEFS_041_00590 [Gordonia effusa NBRC 100432]|uniref:DUF3349 domain-containing protein n=1 Tax=Gordonia effusa NBRC 100432 TaxID=1077974 RepID=H0QYK4_9ACTN|nr:DUF3349 domain-containing protein [Gordonia effusa]GAB17905.1 hypothetical protein GOEFS_041_00590 [Gordonia effusa NBRC 100432]